MEQWRLGALNGADKLSFAYSLDATALNTGTWTAVPALDAVSPVTSGTAEQKLDGNLPSNRAAVSGTLSGLALAPGTTLWLRWVDVNDPGVDDALAIDDMVFGQPVDNPPTLVSSFPTDGDLDFPSNGSLIFTFSEAVSVSGNWFSLVCGTSGSLGPSDANITGGPTTWYVDLSNDLSIGESCALNFVSASILDQDGTADALIDPGTIDFSVIAPPPNEAPTLVSTVPTQSATNFPSAGDLKAVFSEPVTAAAGAFALSCTSSSGIVLTPSSSDGGTTWSINTGTVLESGDSCEFGIVAAYIHDLEGAELDAGASIQFSVLDPGDLNAYYQQVNLATPQSLRCSLYATIKDHTKFPYSGSGTNTWVILNQADEDPVDASMILDVYKNASYTKITGGQGAYNREHVWPRSLGLGDTDTPGPATDTHMLHLTDVGYNANRGNRPLGTVQPAGTKLPTDFNHGLGGNSDADSNWVTGSDGNTGLFEVWDHVKGDMARAVMYMAIRYRGENGEPNLELTDNTGWITPGGNDGKNYMGKLADLLAWNSFDPPTIEEIDRNNLVYSYQLNRNPFIDHPEWASGDLFSPLAQALTPCALNLEPPVAANDNYATGADTQLTVNAAGVLTNDNDPEGAPMTASVVSAASHGSVMLGGSGGFTYTPNAGYCGTDNFTYKASDGVRESAPATVTIEVGSNCGGPTWNGFSDGFEG